MNSRYRYLIGVVVVALLATSMVFSARALAAEGRFERTLKVTGPVDLDVRTGAGTITVRTGDAASVVVRGVIKTHGEHGGEDAEKKVRYLESNPPIEQNGNIIKVGHIEDPELPRYISISYDLVVPVETRLRSGSGSGDQTVDGIRGPLDASTGSGSLKLSNIGDTVKASTGSGDVQLNGVKGHVRASTGSGGIRAMGIAGGLRASTGSGDVTLEQTAAGDVEVNTASGSIRLKGVRGSLHAQTASGDIIAEGEGSGSWRLETASGNVTVRLPAKQGFHLNARSVSGSIHTAREMTVQGTISQHELRGKVGDGGFQLDVSTVSGSVRIE